MLIVENTPRKPPHFFALFRENRLYPVDHRAEIVPQLHRTGVILMFSHVRFNGFSFGTGCPENSRFKVFLTDRSAFQIITSQRTCCAAGLRKIPLCVRSPAAGIDGVPQLLISQFFACNVDNTKPFQLFTVRTITHIYE